MADQEQLVEEFKNVTGEDAERSRFYLEAASWELNVRMLEFVLSKAGVAQEMAENLMYSHLHCLDWK